MEEKRLGQLLLMGVPGVELDPVLARRLRALQPGGFIIFGRNIQSPEQLRKLLDDLRDLSEVEPILTIDQEGGRVSRLRLIGHEPPNAQQLREKADRDLVSIFVLPPSMRDLEQRLRARAQDSDEVIHARMARAADEMSHWAEYDYVVINSEIARAFADVRSILAAERLRRERQTGLSAFVRRLQAEL